MSTNVMPHRLFQITIVLAAIVSIGCATRGYERASETVSNIDTLKTELTTAKKHLDNSVNALDKVVSSKDATGPYEEFVHALAEMDGQADTIHAQAEAVRSSGDAYFEDWEAKLASFTSEDMRKISEQRRADLTKTYDEINAASQKTKEAYEPLMADLNDIKQYLGLDLSAASVAGIGDQVKKVKTGAGKVQESIDALLEVLDQLSTKLATGVDAPTSSEEAPASKEASAGETTPSTESSSSSETPSSEKAADEGNPDANN